MQRITDRVPIVAVRRRRYLTREVILSRNGDSEFSYAINKLQIKNYEL
jgi:hypothetical protein